MEGKELSPARVRDRKTGREEVHTVRVHNDTELFLRREQRNGSQAGGRCQESEVTLRALLGLRLPLTTSGI